MCRGVEQWKLVGLITRRPLVRIQPPLPIFYPRIPLNLGSLIGLESMAIQIEFLKSIPYFSELSLAELEQVGKFIFEKTAQRVGIAYGGEIKAPKI